MIVDDSAWDRAEKRLRMSLIRGKTGKHINKMDSTGGIYLK